MKIKMLIGLVLLIPVMIYVWMNSSPISIHFLAWTYAVPQALLVLSTLLVGVILGLFLSSAWRNKEKNLLKKKARQAKKLKKSEEKQKKQQEKQQPVEPPATELPPVTEISGGQREDQGQV